MKIIKARLPAEDLTMSQRLAMDHWQNLIANLVKAAVDYGVVITIDNPPNEPLAMGNYDLVVSARPLRNFKG